MASQFYLPIVSSVPEAKDIMDKIIPAVFESFILISIAITGSMTFQSAIQRKNDAKMPSLALKCCDIRLLIYATSA